MHLVAEGAEGIISFPSLHAALGLLFLLALWPVKYVGWIATLLNLAMIAATPVDGSHYFSDVAAGLAIALVSWIAVRHALTRMTGERMEAGGETYLPRSALTEKPTRSAGLHSAAIEA